MLNVLIPTPRGRMPAYLAVPSTTAPTPGVVVLHDVFGMSQDHRNQAEWLAEAGFLAISPDLYYKGGRLMCIRAVIRDMMARTGDAFDDVEAARTWLAGQPNCGQGWRHQSVAVQGHRLQRSRSHGCAPAHHRFLPHAPRGLIKQRMGGKVFTLAAARPWVVLNHFSAAFTAKAW